LFVLPSFHHSFSDSFLFLFFSHSLLLLSEYSSLTVLFVSSHFSRPSFIPSLVLFFLSSHAHPYIFLSVPHLLFYLIFLFGPFFPHFPFFAFPFFRIFSVFVLFSSFFHFFSRFLQVVLQVGPAFAKHLLCMETILVSVSDR
jgi:hypothetical protein